MMTVLEMDALIHIAMPSGLHDNSKTMILLMVLHVTTPRELNDTGTYSGFLMMLQDGDAMLSLRVWVQDVPLSHTYSVWLL